MSLVYRFMYRVGFTPWDTGTIPRPLSALIEGDPQLEPASALDIGCGTGTQAVFLAQRGWQVTGVELLDQPLRRARARAAAAGVEVDFVKADATRLRRAKLEPGFALLLDRGCFHGLSDDGRAGYVDGVTALAAPGATLLLMAFARNRVLAGPTGADETELVSRFSPGWKLERSERDSEPPPGGPLKGVPLTWYWLRRSGSGV
ncbi:MAG TPA: methyltransferase domain-containing protein [Solirubrobacteraceae bacterium]|jgi:SAM-dependent methyltransferase|nr:methyltransferase domain-containing protein [Solirubrobacteraceae bacterium]